MWSLQVLLQVFPSSNYLLDTASLESTTKGMRNTGGGEIGFAMEIIRHAIEVTAKRLLLIVLWVRT